MRKLTVGLFAALFAITGIACGEKGGGSGGGGDESVNALAAAADNANEAGSAGMSMTVEMDAAGQQMTVTGEGAFDFDDQLGEMTMTMEGAGLPEGLEIDMIVQDQYAFMKMPPELGMGAGWYRMDMSSMPAVGANGASQFSQDMSQYLDFLRGASEGEIEEVGTEEIDGVTTTHYKADLSFAKMLEQLPESEVDELEAQMEALGGSVKSIPAEVWIDEDGLPRRMKMTMSIDAQGQSIEMDIDMEFFDYGLEVNVEPPAKFEELPTS
jgi:hypothetical protein